MAVCGLRTILLIVCVLELLVTGQRQVFDFLGYMWLPIIANFTNIILIIFGAFGAVQYITNYLFAYAVWSFMWLIWNVFLICFYLNVGSLNRESGLLSLGTGSYSWWETNGWGCQPVWGDVEEQGPWRPTRVDGCFLQWDHVELAQSVVGALFAAAALPLAAIVAFTSVKKHKPATDKSTLSRRPAYTIELSGAEAAAGESSLKPMTPRRVKRRSVSRGGSARRSRRSYRNAAYLASTASLPRDRSRPTSAHSSYSNFHAARPPSYPADTDPPSESVAIVTNRHNSVPRRAAPSASSGYDVAGPYKEAGNYKEVGPYKEPAPEPAGEDMSRGWGEPPPPAPPYEYEAHGAAPYSPSPAPYTPRGEAYGAAYPRPYGTPVSPGPPAYQPANDIIYTNLPPPCH